MAAPLTLFGGPAGAGKSTLAEAWCATRRRAVHLQLDQIRRLIVSGRADPQHAGELQREQYATSVAATCALARVFSASEYDVAIDDVFEPDSFDAIWTPQLDGLDWQFVVILPSLESALARARGRSKKVPVQLTRAQHVSCSRWPAACCLDTTGLDIPTSLKLVIGYLARTPSERSSHHLGKSLEAHVGDQ